MDITKLHKQRYSYKPQLPSILKDIENVSIQASKRASLLKEDKGVDALFPHINKVVQKHGKAVELSNKAGGNINSGAIKVAIILSGGPAAGGHNVITGLYDALKKVNKQSQLFGFKGGSGGLVKGDIVEFDSTRIDEFRNTGGFDIVGSGRTKIETDEQFKASLETAKKLNLDAIVMIGGDDSNTNACLLAEYFIANGSKTQVIGIPKTIDGDLKNDFISISFGFDTATKTYAELIGNICRDAVSSRKYWHFIKLMGRSASHIALECALLTNPNYTVISEEVEKENKSLDAIVSELSNIIIKRSEGGEDFGVVLIPEGLVEFVPAMQKLIKELNDLLGHHEVDFKKLETTQAQIEFILKHLNSQNAETFKNLPFQIQEQFLLERDPHGNVQVSIIETEKLLISLVKDKLKKLNFKGKFSALNHFFGYEGRCAFPSNFDATYCYVLGYTGASLILNGLSGYLAYASPLSKDVQSWTMGGISTASLMNLERRHGKDKPVIKKALVELEGKAFKHFASIRGSLSEKSLYKFPGPIQFDESIVAPETVRLEEN